MSGMDMLSSVVDRMHVELKEKEKTTQAVKTTPHIDKGK
jgi:hypothetical protein